MSVWEISQDIVHLVDLAQKQGHRITTCDICGGPRIWRLKKPESHCFRCNKHYISSPWMTCRDCKKTVKWQVSKYCRKCQQKRHAVAQTMLVVDPAVLRAKSLEKASENDDI